MSPVSFPALVSPGVEEIIISPGGRWLHNANSCVLHPYMYVQARECASESVALLDIITM